MIIKINKLFDYIFGKIENKSRFGQLFPEQFIYNRSLLQSLKLKYNGVESRSWCFHVLGFNYMKADDVQEKNGQVTIR